VPRTTASGWANVTVWVVFNVMSVVEVSDEPARTPEMVAVPVPRAAGAVKVAL
jgi:hypothetical protein